LVGSSSVGTFLIKEATAANKKNMLAPKGITLGIDSKMEDLKRILW